MAGELVSLHRLVSCSVELYSTCLTKGDSVLDHAAQCEIAPG